MLESWVLAFLQHESLMDLLVEDGSDLADVTDRPGLYPLPDPEGGLDVVLAAPAGGRVGGRQGALGQGGVHLTQQAVTVVLGLLLRVVRLLLLMVVLLLLMVVLLLLMVGLMLVGVILLLLILVILLPKVVLLRVLV